MYDDWMGSPIAVKKAQRASAKSIAMVNDKQAIPKVLRVSMKVGGLVTTVFNRKRGIRKRKMTMIPTICPNRFTCKEAMVPSGIRRGTQKLSRIREIAPIARSTNPIKKRNAGVKKLKKLSSRSLSTKEDT